jgi:hypothetical protein
MIEGVNSIMMYLIYCKNFCKCHNVSLAQQFKKIFLKKKKPRRKRCVPEKLRQA